MTSEHSVGDAAEVVAAVLRSTWRRRVPAPAQRAGRNLFDAMSQPTQAVPGRGRSRTSSDRPPCVIGIPMMNLHEETAAVIADLEGDAFDELIIFDHGSDDPATLAWLREVEQRPRIRVDRRGVIPEESLYRAWNDTIRQALDRFPLPEVDVVLLNNDVRLPRGFVRFLANALRSDDPHIMIAFPDKNAPIEAGLPDAVRVTRTRGLHPDGGLTGWAFALKAEAFRGMLPFIDERLKIYSGDRDLVHAVETRGYYAAQVDGLPCHHVLGTTRRRRPEIKEQQERDIALWWSEHPEARVTPHVTSDGTEKPPSTPPRLLLSAPMRRHQFLADIHARCRPRNYLEIGVSEGDSLRLSRVPSIAIDPAFKVVRPLRCDLHLVRATSDAFFSRRDPIRHLRSGRNPLKNLRRGRPPFAHYRGGNVIDFAFIDGLHLFEFALRDFMNAERFTGPGSIIVLDDIYPRTVDEAARNRHTSDWTGDVYKIIDVLRRYRPDLIVLPMDTAPTGVLVVLGADSHSRTLASSYDSIVAEQVRPDPQTVPDEVLQRSSAIEPQRFPESPILPLVASLRGSLAPTSKMRRLRELAAGLMENPSNG